MLILYKYKELSLYIQKYLITKFLYGKKIKDRCEERTKIRKKSICN